MWVVRHSSLCRFSLESTGMGPVGLAWIKPSFSYHYLVGLHIIFKPLQSEFKSKLCDEVMALKWGCLTDLRWYVGILNGFHYYVKWFFFWEHLLFCVLFVFYLFWDKVWCSLGSPQTLCNGKWTWTFDPPASASRVLELQDVLRTGLRASCTLPSATPTEPASPGTRFLTGLCVVLIFKFRWH